MVELVQAVVVGVGVEAVAVLRLQLPGLRRQLRVPPLLLLLYLCTASVEG